MAAYMYLGAVVHSNTSDEDMSYKNIDFIKPSIIEENYRCDLADIAKKYRKIKSIEETETIVIWPITDDTSLSRKAILTSLIKSKFSYATLLTLSTATNPLIADSMYIESGLNQTSIESLIPDWYKKISSRTSLKLYKDLSEFDDQ